MKFGSHGHSMRMLGFEVFSISEIASDVQKAAVESDLQKATEHQIAPCRQTEICGKRFSAESDVQLKLFLPLNWEQGDKVVSIMPADDRPLFL